MKTCRFCSKNFLRTGLTLRVFLRRLCKSTMQTVLKSAKTCSLTIILFAVVTFAPAFCLTTAGSLVVIAIQMAISVNIGLGVFNLVPLPPLDGSKILIHFLPYKARMWFTENKQIFYMVFIVLWVTNLVSYIISPVISVVSKGIYLLVSAIFGLF